MISVHPVEAITEINNMRQIKEVILCENCKWWERHSPSFGDCHNPRWGDGYGLYAPPITDEEAFCKYAKRRTNDD